MERYEYIVDLVLKEEGPGGLQNRLNSWGKDGWRLLHISFLTGGKPPVTSWLCILEKRIVSSSRT
ncbi:MAG: hypothetical protein HY459_03680 [Parcubacteria group bacterium]|nr:hypothetical protein [Parcubacteria group bacterium]